MMAKKNRYIIPSVLKILVALAVILASGTTSATEDLADMLPRVIFV